MFNSSLTNEMNFFFENGNESNSIDTILQRRGPIKMH